MATVRRCRRILLNAAAVVSLLLCAATVVLWMRSHFVCDIVNWGSHRPRAGIVLEESLWAVVADAGVVVIANFELIYQGPERDFEGVRGELLAEPGWRWTRSPPEYRRPTAGGVWSWMGFGHEVQNTSFGAGGSTGMTTVYIPCWAVVAVTAALPAARCWNWASARRRKRRRGYCPDCGYDLRATPDRCPECGREAASR